MNNKWHILKENPNDLPPEDVYGWLDTIYGVFRGIYLINKENNKIEWIIDPEPPFNYMFRVTLRDGETLAWMHHHDNHPHFIRPERSKREDSQQCEMRCSEHCGNTVRDK